MPHLRLSVPAGRLGAFEIGAGPVLAVLSLAGLVYVPVVGSPGVLVFLAAGCGLFLLRPGPVLARSLRAWPVLLIALFCILSVTWSREPALTLRYGVQLAATAAVTLALCDRLSPRAFCLALALLLGPGMVASVVAGGVSGESGAWTGIYGSKNAFAGAAATFAIVAIGFGLARGGRALKAVALLAGLASLLLVLLAQSVGALALLAVTGAASLSVLALARMSPVGRVGLIAGGGLLAVLAGLAASAYLQPLSEMMLESTGKDLTLTGRTELWAVAVDLIAQRPLLGVGYQAFWVRGNAEAEALWFMFGIDSRDGFNFHNMYLSNAVEIGILGVLIQCGVLFGAGGLTLLWALRTGGATAAVFFALTFMVCLGSVIEVPLFFQFSLRTVLVFAAFSYAREALGRSR